jgi:predicted aldo/keto reductase-like oxidoreductase
MLDRRELIRRGLALGLAPALLPLAAPALLPLAAGGAPAEPPRVRRRVALGKTGLELPDIGFGSSMLAGDEALVAHALARGIRYFDTAEGYRGGASEETLGRALAGKRDEVLLASKQSTSPRTKRAEMMETLEGSLRRLRTDRIDVYFDHAVNDPDRITNDEWYEFTARAKQQGKIRFTGISGHGGRLVECVELAVERKLVDVLLVAFNFGQDPAFYERFTGSFDFVARQPELPRVLRKARVAGIGVVAMKTLRGAKLNDMRPYEGAGATFAQAAFRWVFASGLADALIVTMRRPAEVDEYLGASGWTAPHPADAGLLRRYTRRTETTQCRYGCSDCQSACPAGVSIPDVLRARMYAFDYEAPELAHTALSEAGGAAACLSCDGAPCASACPHGVAIPALTKWVASAFGAA